MLNIIKTYWPTLIVVAVILYGTLASHPIGEDEIPPIPYIDKLIHAVMMGGLFGAIVFDWQRSHRSHIITNKLLAYIFIIVALFSIADEFLQGIINNDRSSDPFDLVADIAGVVVALFTAPVAVRRVLGINHRPN